MTILGGENMRIAFDRTYSPYGYGWYAYFDFENNILSIDYEAPREGGTLYKGEYKGAETPYLNEIKKEDPILYNEIIEHFDHIKE